jgi:hypothetical protein
VEATNRLERNVEPENPLNRPDHNHSAVIDAEIYKMSDISLNERLQLELHRIRDGFALNPGVDFAINSGCILPVWSKCG